MHHCAPQAGISLAEAEAALGAAGGAWEQLSAAQSLGAHVQGSDSSVGLGSRGETCSDVGLGGRGATDSGVGLKSRGAANSNVGLGSRGVTDEGVSGQVWLGGGQAELEGGSSAASAGLLEAVSQARGLLVAPAAQAQVSGEGSRELARGQGQGQGGSALWLTLPP